MQDNKVCLNKLSVFLRDPFAGLLSLGVALLGFERSCLAGETDYACGLGFSFYLATGLTALDALTAAFGITLPALLDSFIRFSAAAVVLLSPIRFFLVDLPSFLFFPPYRPPATWSYVVWPSYY